MKYSIKLLYSALSLMIILILSSCENFLDLKPINTPVENTFWKTESDANAGVLGAYSKLRETLEFGWGLTYFTYGDFPTQIFSDAEWGQHEFTGTYQYSGNNSISDWTKFYKVILATNVAIKNVPEMPLEAFTGSEVKRNQYVGEALFIRAYTYFYMLRIWKSVPLVISPIQDASEAIYDVAVATEDQLLNQCIEDLKLADSYLDWGSTAGERASRANRASVNALLAHVYMWRTRPNRAEVDKTDFDKSIACIELIENNSGATLVEAEQYSSIWKGSSAESLFEVPFKIANKEGFPKNGGFADRFMGYPYNTDRKDREPIFKFSPEFLNLFREPESDLRVANLFENFSTIRNCFTIKYNQIQYTNADKSDWQTEGTVVLYRLADMYLLKAEALCKKNNPDFGMARIYLNKIRSRAGLGDYDGVDNNLYEEIVDERSRELFLEGHRLYDWVRTGFYAKKSRNGVYSEDRYAREGYLFPVNFNLIVNNKYVKQTPYWEDKMAY